MSQGEQERKREREREREISTSSLLSDSSDDDGLSSDDEDGGVSGGGGANDGKLLLRIKKAKLSSSSKERDPLAKLLKTKRPPILKKKLMAIYRSLVTKTDNNGRLLCELFMKRPSASMYPQYYVVIKNPIDLKEILQKIRSEVYSKMAEMMNDVELLVENACTFNEEDSQVYKVQV